MKPLSIAAFIQALLTLVVSFGLPISDHQQASILAFVGTGVPVALAVAAWYQSRHSTSRKAPTDYDGTPLVPESTVTDPRNIF